MTTLPLPEQFKFNIESLKETFQHVKHANSWQDKYRHIMLLSKKMPSIAVTSRHDQALVKGCESRTWLYHYQMQQQHFFLIDSEARIVKGLAGLLLTQLQGKNAQTISDFDVDDFYRQLGLAGQLSPSRSNGLNALIITLQAFATKKATD